jgi:sulfite exporter TauE/SafE
MPISGKPEIGGRASFEGRASCGHLRMTDHKTRSGFRLASSWSRFGAHATMDYLLVLAAGLVAGTISGIVGTGSSIILVPILVIAFGPKQAVPTMAIAALMANLARILAWWREVDWRAGITLLWMAIH